MVLLAAVALYPAGVTMLLLPLYFPGKTPQLDEFVLTFCIYPICSGPLVHGSLLRFQAQPLRHQKAWVEEATCKTKG